MNRRQPGAGPPVALPTINTPSRDANPRRGSFDNSQHPHSHIPPHQPNNQPQPQPIEYDQQNHHHRRSRSNSIQPLRKEQTGQRLPPLDPGPQPRHVEGNDSASVIDGSERSSLVPARHGQALIVPASNVSTTAPIRQPMREISPQARHAHPYAQTVPLGAHDLLDELMAQTHLLDQRLCQSNSPQHVRTESPRIMCALCDDPDYPPQRAAFYCEQCRTQGLPYEFCERCWPDEHRSRRTRDHRRLPIPIMHDTSVASSTSSANATASQSSVDARIVLAMQQQMLQLLRNITPKVTGTVGSQTVETSTDTSQALENLSAVVHQPSGNDSSSGVLLLANHDQDMLKRATTDRLDQVEARERAELEGDCAFGHNLILQLMVNQTARLVIRQQPKAQGGRPPLVPQSSESANRSTLSPSQSASGVQQQASPQRAASRGGQRTRTVAPPESPYTSDAVVVVHGEKHLPGQPQMLLVQLSNGDEEWVELEAVLHCPQVHLYLQRKFTPEPRMGSADLNPDDGELPSDSVLEETERRELAAQLAALKRLGTAGTSRGSLGLEDGAWQALGGAPPSAGQSPINDDDTSARETPRDPQEKHFDDDRPAPLFPARSSTAPEHAMRQRKRAIIQQPTPRDRATEQEENLQEARTPNEEADQEEQPVVDAPTAPTDIKRDPSPRSNPQPAPPPPPPPRAVRENTNRPRSDFETVQDATGEVDPPPLIEEQAVVKRYEEKLRRLEQRHKTLRENREEQQQKLEKLRDRQQLGNDENRRRVHDEYEAHKDTLQREQPELQHPLYNTNERHAALLLHKLNQEIEQADRERQYRKNARDQQKRPTEKSNAAQEDDA